MGDRLLALGAMLIAPPFAFLLGLIVAVVVWLSLAEVDIPSWARVGLSLLAVPAIPGLWFLILPILVGATTARRLGDDEFREWQDQQVRAWEDHRDVLAELGRQPIERVIASGTAVTTSGVTITLIAVALGPAGGDIGLAETGQTDDSVHLPVWDVMAGVSDDAGTDYVVIGSPVEMNAVGARTHIAFFPAVPADATELRLRITKILRPGELASLPGPWDFTVPLRERGTPPS